MTTIRRIFHSGHFGKGRPAWLAAMALLSLQPFFRPGQGPPPGQSPGEELVARVRAAIGAGAPIDGLRSLSFSARQTHHGRERDTRASVRVEMILPDRFLRTEESNPAPMTFVTLTEAMNGARVWVNRKVRTPSGSDDGAAEVAVRQPTQTSPSGSDSSSMRGATSGVSTVRTSPPGAVTSERTLLGMRLPSASGRDLNTASSEMEKDKQKSARESTGYRNILDIANPGFKSSLESQLRKEFLAFIYALTASSPGSFPVTARYVGVFNLDNLAVEIIDLAGPEGFSGRLFIDRKSSLPSLLIYIDNVRRGAGYVISASGRQPEGDDYQTIVVQMIFSDYRQVDGLMLPHQFVKAVNGTPVDEWKIEKYRINPDIKPGRFEQKRK